MSAASGFFNTISRMLKAIHLILESTSIQEYKIQMELYKIGIDLGGTKIEGIVLDNNGDVVIRTRVPTEQEKGYEVIISNIGALYNELNKKICFAAHTLGFGSPGAVSNKTGLLKNSNTQCLNGKPLLQDLEKNLKHKLAIQNDANCFASAEAVLGAGKNKSTVFGVIMGTGCGGGFVINGKPVTGLQSIAGEWGHSTIDKNGPVCYCGKKGCIEKYISGGGWSDLFFEKTGKRMQAEDIAKQARNGNTECKKSFQEFLQNFGIAMGNLISILDPDIVVLGGGLSNIEELYSDGVEQVKKYVFSDSLDTPIVKNKLGDSAGVFGAALIGV
jgi:fructokinase